MVQERRQSQLLALFIILSLLLHLLVMYLLPQRTLFPEPAAEPVYVEIRPPQAQPQPKQRELDVPSPPEPEKPRETPAKRLGPQDQVVTREIAPQGEDFEDLRPSAPPAQARPKPPPQPQPKPQTQAPAAAEPRRPARDDRAPAAETPRPQAQPAQETARETPPLEKLPDLQSLLTLPQATVARLETEWRKKYRADVEQGDAVWLDMEKDLLHSFFKRFRDNIYGVWNYPARSAERGDEGTCLLKITVNHDGTLRQVQLMETSGHPALDEEALQAVRKGSPFGPLPRSFTKEELSIFAFFRYNLTRRVIY